MEVLGKAMDEKRKLNNKVGEDAERLIEDLSDAINRALCTAGVADALAALENAGVDVEVALDVMIRRGDKRTLEAAPSAEESLRLTSESLMLTSDESFTLTSESPSLTSNDSLRLTRNDALFLAALGIAAE